MKTLAAILVGLAALTASSFASAEESTKKVDLSVGDVTQETVICYSGKTCAIGLVGDAKLDFSFSVNGIEVESDSMGCGKGGCEAHLMITNKDKLPKVMLLLVTNPTSHNLHAELRSGNW